MNLPQGALVKFDMGNVSGDGYVCGIFNTGVAGLGVGYMVELANLFDREGKVLVYEYSNIGVFDSQIVSATPDTRGLHVLRHELIRKPDIEDTCVYVPGTK